MDTTVRNANGLLTTVGGNLNVTLDGVRTTIGNVNDIVVDLKHGKGPAGMLLHDETVSAQIRQTLTTPSRRPTTSTRRLYRRIISSPIYSHASYRRRSMILLSA